MKILRKVANFPTHVFFLTAFSILSLLASNLTQVNLNAANRLFIAFEVGTVLLLLLVWLLIKDFDRAGVVVLLFLMIFYTYGHVYNFLHANIFAFGRNVFLLPIALVLLLGGFYLVLRLPQANFRRMTPYLNLIYLLLLVYPTITIISYEVRITSYQRIYRTQMESSSVNTVAFNGNLPDVYFIILDGYARSDVLKQITGLDNSNFLDGLRQSGFYVADCSMSNYAQTEESMASTLNMMYLDKLFAVAPQASWSSSGNYFAPYIQHSSVRGFFESLGYKTVSFYTGYSWSQWEDSTYYMGDPRLTSAKKVGISAGNGFLLSAFENKYMQSTLLVSLLDLYKKFYPVSIALNALNGTAAARAVVLYPLDNMLDIAKLDSPEFVFLHLLLPHPPYVFGPNGEVRSVDLDTADLQTRLKAYSDQVQYANSRILPLVNDLISLKGGNIVIFLEGDHGLIDYQESWNRMTNLSAYYFPNQDYSRLYPQITPVNSFRVLLDQYFGQEYPLLPDNSYFTSTSGDQNFELIPNNCIGK